jgi:hypothetical protein
VLLVVFYGSRGGYASWPRRRVYDQLAAEIAKLEKLVDDRRDKIVILQRRNGAPAAGAGTAAGFVEEKLKQIPIRQVLNITGMSLTTLRLLQAQRVDSAWDLRERLEPGHPQAIKQLPPHLIYALQTWCLEQELQAADEFRRQGSAATAGPAPPLPKAVQADVERLGREVAGFETELEKLRLEQEHFPDVSAKTYFRKLLGLPTD